jgi:hypothetical protein
MLSQLGPAERGQLQPLQRRQPHQLSQQGPQWMPPMQLIGPVADHQEHLTHPEGAGQEGDHVTAGAVSPVQILQYHHHRGLLRPAHQQSAHSVKHLQLVQAVARHTYRPWPRHRWQEPAEARHDAGDLS